MPNLNPLLIAALAAASLASARAGDTEWHLDIRKQDGGGWTASLSSSQDYGPAGGQRLRGSGVRVDKARQVGAFDKLRLEGPIDLRFTQTAAGAASGSETVRVLADDNVEPLIETRTEGDTLVLRLQPGASFSTRHTPTVAIDARALRSLVMNGSGDVRLERLKGDALTVVGSGSGDLQLGSVELRELTVTLRGSGDVRVAGRADTQNWTVQGSGDVEAQGLSGRSVTVQLSGSGDMDIGASDSLDVKLRGSGDLRYAGRPQLRQNVSGSGELSRR